MNDKLFNFINQEITDRRNNELVHISHNDIHHFGSIISEEDEDEDEDIDDDNTHSHTHHTHHAHPNTPTTINTANIDNNINNPNNANVFNDGLTLPRFDGHTLSSTPVPKVMPPMSTATPSATGTMAPPPAPQMTTSSSAASSDSSSVANSSEDEICCCCCSNDRDHSTHSRQPGGIAKYNEPSIGYDSNDIYEEEDSPIDKFSSSWPSLPPFTALPSIREVDGPQRQQQPPQSSSYPSQQSPSKTAGPSAGMGPETVTSVSSLVNNEKEPLSAFSLYPITHTKLHHHASNASTGGHHHGHHYHNYHLTQNRNPNYTTHHFLSVDTPSYHHNHNQHQQQIHSQTNQVRQNQSQSFVTNQTFLDNLNDFQIKSILSKIGNNNTNAMNTNNTNVNPNNTNVNVNNSNNPNNPNNPNNFVVPSFSDLVKAASSTSVQPDTSVAPGAPTVSGQFAPDAVNGSAFPHASSPHFTSQTITNPTTPAAAAATVPLQKGNAVLPPQPNSQLQQLQAPPPQQQQQHPQVQTLSSSSGSSPSSPLPHLPLPTITTGQTATAAASSPSPLSEISNISTPELIAITNKATFPPVTTTTTIQTQTQQTQQTQQQNVQFMPQIQPPAPTTFNGNANTQKPIEFCAARGDYYSQNLPSPLLQTTPSQQQHHHQAINTLPVNQQQACQSNPIASHGITSTVITPLAMAASTVTNFRITREPHDVQRKSYKNEKRYLVPKPIVVSWVGPADVDVRGTVDVSLANEDGSDLPPSVQDALEGTKRKAINIEDKTASFSLIMRSVSGDSKLRLRFVVTYKVGEKTSTEILFSLPFKVESNRKKMVTERPQALSIKPKEGLAACAEEVWVWGAKFSDKGSVRVKFGDVFAVVTRSDGNILECAAPPRMDFRESTTVPVMIGNAHPGGGILWAPEVLLYTYVVPGVGGNGCSMK